MRRSLLVCAGLFVLASGCTRSEDDLCGVRPVSGSAPSPLRPGPCEVFFDVDGDDEIDFREVYRYDDQDQEIERYTYYDGPQCNSAVRHFNEFAEGRRIRQRRDALVDGTFESTVDYTYDEMGRLSETRELQLDADGAERTTATTRYAYNDAGQLDSVSVLRGTDNARIQRTRYLYDDDGRLTQEVREGGINSTETLVYGDSGLVNRRDIDEDGDGETDAQNSLVYDAAGNLLRESTLRFSDGYIVRGVEYDYSCW